MISCRRWCAGLLGDWEFDLDFVGLAEVVARDLVARVGRRLAEFLAERELDIGEAGFFLQLALRAGEPVFARIDQSLRKIPVVVGAQDEKVEAAAGAPDDHHAGGARRRLGLHRRHATDKTTAAGIRRRFCYASLTGV